MHRNLVWTHGISMLCEALDEEREKMPVGHENDETFDHASRLIPTFICIDPDRCSRLSGHSSSLLPASFSHVTRESVVETAGCSSEPKATASKGIGSVSSSYPERVSASSKYLEGDQIEW